MENVFLPWFQHDRAKISIEVNLYANFSTIMLKSR